MICKICNKEFKTVKGLCSHIMQIHKGISLLQYYELFLWSKTYCKICENKPKFINFVQGFSEYCDECLIKMYSSSFRIQHGITTKEDAQKHFEKISISHKRSYKDKRDRGIQKLTPTMKEYWTNKGLTEEEAEKQRRVLLQETWDANKNYRIEEPERYTDCYSNQLGYWLKRGLSEDEAKIKVTERQRTFTLEKCINKYGVEKGTQKYNERQLKWVNTMKNLPNYDEIKLKRLSHFRHNNYGVSKSSQSFLWDLYNRLDNKDNRNIYFHELNYEYILGIDREILFLDFFDADKKICVEYNGDYWHNLEKQKIKDIKRQEILEKNGYKLILVWESDRNKDINFEINKCLEILNG